MPPLRRPPTPTLFPYTTLFRSATAEGLTLAEFNAGSYKTDDPLRGPVPQWTIVLPSLEDTSPESMPRRSEEHTSELQSPCNLVCRLLLEKKNSSRRHTLKSPYA